jgi:tetratricopeptide (TPR) repeat protein
MEMRRSTLSLIAFAMAALSTAPVNAQSALDRKTCEEIGISPQRRVDACTAVINAGRLDKATLAAMYGRRGAAYRQMKNLEAAIADYDHAVGLDPNDAVSYMVRGNANRARKKYDEAIADYRQAIKLDRNRPGPYTGLGNVYYDKGDFDLAIANHTEAIRLDPKYALAYVNRGEVYFQKQDYNRAISDFTATLRLNPKYVSAYEQRGRANLFAGALPKALSDLNQASELDPKDAYTALWLDIVNKRSGLPSRLADAIRQIDMTRWPAPVIRLYLGQLTPEAVLAAANSIPQTVEGQVCEANFYTGELALQQTRKDEAKRRFALAAADCPTWRAEAIAELKALGVSQ